MSTFPNHLLILIKTLYPESVVEMEDFAECSRCECLLFPGDLALPVTDDTILCEKCGHTLASRRVVVYT